MEGGKAAVLVGVPPVFEGAHGHRGGRALAGGPRRGRGDRFQGHSQRHRLPEQLLELTEERITGQGDGLGPRFGCMGLHGSEDGPARACPKTEPVCVTGSRLPGPRRPTAQRAQAAAASSDNPTGGALAALRQKLEDPAQ